MDLKDFTPPPRHFSHQGKDTTDKINWTNLERIIDAFERRVKDWYFEPAKKLIDDMPGPGFIITSIGCTLIDKLTQYREGKKEGEAPDFINFTEKHFSDFTEEIKPAIPKKLVPGPTPVDINKVSQAFYSGFRCGIVHNGTILPFGGIPTKDKNKLFELVYDTSDPTKHCYVHNTQKKYPFLRVNPAEVIHETETVFQNYLSNLRGANKTDVLVINFTDKLVYDFGKYGKKLKKSLGLSI